MKVSQIEQALGINVNASISQLGIHNQYLLSAAESLKGLQAGHEAIFSLFPKNHPSALSQFENELEKLKNRCEKINSPLSHIREILRLSDQLNTAINSSALSSINRYAEIDKLTSPLAALSTSSLNTERINELLEGISLTHTNRFAELVEPYQNLLRSSASSISMDTINKTLGQHDWQKRLQLPVIDEYSVSAIAHLWGREGIEKQLQSFGIDYQRYLEDIESETAVKSPTALQQFKIPRIDFWTVFGILLTILVAFQQNYASEQSEERITSDIKNLNHKIDNNNKIQQANTMMLLEQILQNLIDAQSQQKEDRTQFVVSSRVALIRNEPSHGANIIAEVFPNQVVTLLGKNGKWIEVEYFDWINQEIRNGWLLKKYVKRVTSKASDSL